MAWYTVNNAAQHLGISAGAVRARIHRGTLQTQRDNDTVYVYITDEPYAEDTHRNTTIEDELREQVAYLKSQLATRDEEIRRRDHLLAAALERIPELQESPQSSVTEERYNTPSDDASEPHSQSSKAQEQDTRSWWRRLFGR